MTPTLRRSHRFLWLALALVLPVGFIMALRQTGQPLAQEPIGPTAPVALPILVRSVSNPDLTLTLRKAVRTPDQQLEILVKTALETPSAVVRVRQAGGWRAVGLLSAPDVYRFAMPGTETHPEIDVWDDIHGRTLYTFSF